MGHIAQPEFQPSFWRSVFLPVVDYYKPPAGSPAEDLFQERHKKKPPPSEIRHTEDFVFLHFHLCKDHIE